MSQNMNQQNRNQKNERRINWVVRGCKDNELTLALQYGAKEGMCFLNLNEYPDYRQVSPQHYVDTSTGELVALPTIHNRVITMIDGVVYRRASQYEFDEYCHTRIPEENDNDKVFCKLTDICREL